MSYGSESLSTKYAAVDSCCTTNNSFSGNSISADSHSTRAIKSRGSINLFHNYCSFNLHEGGTLFLPSPRNLLVCIITEHYHRLLSLNITLQQLLLSSPPKLSTDRDASPTESPIMYLTRTNAFLKINSSES